MGGNGTKTRKFEAIWVEEKEEYILWQNYMKIFGSFMEYIAYQIKDISNGVSYAWFRQVMKEIRHFENQCAQIDTVSGVRSASRQRRSAIVQRRSAQNAAPRRYSVPRCPEWAQNAPRCPEIAAPRRQSRSAAALLHQIGPYNSEKARNSPKLPNFLPWTLKL